MLDRPPFDHPDRPRDRISRRDAIGFAAGAVIAGLMPRSAGAEALPDYRITESDITVSRTMPVHRSDTPVPSDPNLLFYIQHSQNPNTIVYAARRGSVTPFDPDAPIEVFWRRFSRQGEREALTFFERIFVFGTRTRPEGTSGTRFAARLAASSMAHGILELGPTGDPRIVGKVGDHDVRVIYAYAELGDYAFIPKINFIDVIGRDLASNDYVTRRIKVGF
ncbi:MAG: DUF4833 domain-containing protein [Hyphomicrobiales bacterium]|nr:DUF4833 domain-containing protein [Hyphomicrobiales bacterium]